MKTIKDIFAERRGMQRQIAEEIGIRQSAVSQWKSVPPKRVLDVERITGIPRHELRPDIYPEPVEAAQ